MEDSSSVSHQPLGKQEVMFGSNTKIVKPSGEKPDEFLSPQLFPSLCSLGWGGGHDVSWMQGTRVLFTHVLLVVPPVG